MRIYAKISIITSVAGLTHAKLKLIIYLSLLILLWHVIYRSLPSVVVHVFQVLVSHKSIISPIFNEQIIIIIIETKTFVCVCLCVYDIDGRMTLL